MRAPLTSTAACLAILLAASAGAQEGRGFTEFRAFAFPGVDGRSWHLVQRLRPTLDARIAAHTTLVVAVEASLAEGRDPTDELRRTLEESDFGPFLPLAGCTWADPGHRIFRIHQAADYLIVDRLYVDFYRRTFDLRLGRQAIHWGSAQFFNPTDPFPEVLLTEPWRPRRGINALRATVPFGTMNDGALVIALDDALEQLRAALRLRFNLRGTDLAFVGAYRGEPHDVSFGLDLRGTTGVGWWFETSWTPDDRTELALGLDYSFPELDRLVALAQYYRNSTGLTNPDQYPRPRALAGAQLPQCAVDLPSLLGQTNGAPGLFALARDYLLLGAMLNCSPDFSVNVFALQNLNDGTAIAIPTLTHLIAGSLEFSLSAQLPFTTWGRGGEFDPQPQELRLARELGGKLHVLELSGLVPAATIVCWTRVNF